MLRIEWCMQIHALCSVNNFWLIPVGHKWRWSQVGLKWLCTRVCRKSHWARIGLELTENSGRVVLKSHQVELTEPRSKLFLSWLNLGWVVLELTKPRSKLFLSWLNPGWVVLELTKPRSKLFLSWLNLGWVVLELTKPRSKLFLSWQNHGQNCSWVD